MCVFLIKLQMVLIYIYKIEKIIIILIYRYVKLVVNMLVMMKLMKELNVIAILKIVLLTGNIENFSQIK